MVGELENTYVVKEKRSCGEMDETPTTTVEAWIERLPELRHEYEPQNIPNLDELGLEKALLEKKNKKQKVGRNLRNM